MSIKVFWLEPTDRNRVWLRRYRSSSEHVCAANGQPGAMSYCNGMYNLSEADIRYTADGLIAYDDHLKPPNEDPRWPMKCDACGLAFEPKDAFQLFTKQIYVRPDTGERMTLEEAPPGACWDAWWMTDRAEKHGLKPGVGSMTGPDGRCLIVKCPPDGREWMIDSRASNCTMKDDAEHHCWVRHGRPEDGTLHVDKNGHTCQAGGGSIQTEKWHGFLHNGHLVG